MSASNGINNIAVQEFNIEDKDYVSCQCKNKLISVKNENVEKLFDNLFKTQVKYTKCNFIKTNTIVFLKIGTYLIE